MESAHLDETSTSSVKASPENKASHEFETNIKMDCNFMPSSFRKRAEDK
jgi:hypothetical protein